VARGVPTDWESRRYYMVSNDAMRGQWEQAGIDELLEGMSRMEFMLRFTLALPDLSTTIVGTANIEHLRNNVRVATSDPLRPELMAEVKRRLDAAT